jgi:hypothetical protein
MHAMSVVPRVNGIPAQPVDLDGAFVWLLLAFGAFVVGALVWMALRSVVHRVPEWKRVRCPERGEDVTVLVARTGDAHRLRVVSCRLRDRVAPAGCADACLPVPASTGAR